jgi:aminomethyltransferase
MADSTDQDLLTSPLHQRHVARGAKFAAFGGWSMPLEYVGAVKEHVAVRTAGGIFDVSHLGKAVVRGPGAASFLNECLTNDLGRIATGHAQYTLCCSEGGGVVDDLIAYLRGDDDVFLIPNAANAAEVVGLLEAVAPAQVEVVDRHRDYAVIAVQGKISDAVLEAMGFPTGHPYMSYVQVSHDGADVVVCRTGYTGEVGYELVVPVEAAEAVWDAAIAAGEPLGLAPAGLAARDTLRTEMGYPLHGQDLSREISPVQARLGWAVGWDKPAFWGHEALRREREAGPSRLLRGLVADGRGIPRPGMTVLKGPDSTDAVGAVTSGTYSPTLRKGIALALLDSSIAVGDSVEVDVRGRREPFTVAKPPFVEPGVRGA